MAALSFLALICPPCVVAVQCERLLSVRCPGLLGRTCMACAKFASNLGYLLQSGCAHETSIKISCHRSAATLRRHGLNLSTTAFGAARACAVRDRLMSLHYPISRDTTALLRHVNGTDPHLNLITALQRADVGLRDWQHSLVHKCGATTPRFKTDMNAMFSEE